MSPSLHRASVLMVLLCSCGYPRPDDVATDAALDAGSDASGAPALFAVQPSLTTAGRTITLEGAFDDSALVTLPGESPVAPPSIAPNRLGVSVTDTTTAGDVVVMAGDAVLGPQHVRRATFELGLGSFIDAEPQPELARRFPTLAVARDSAGTVVIGDQLYVIGGEVQTPQGNGNSVEFLNSIEHATINADGSLGPFSLVGGVNLVTARVEPQVRLVGTSLYVIAGLGPAGGLSSVERATVAADGTLGAFEEIPQTLMHGRYGHDVAIAGSYLYVIAGSSGLPGTGPIGKVERARINADSSLASFEDVSDLQTPRSNATVEVLGDTMYVLGGIAGTFSLLNNIERATISGDGTIGPFGDAGVVLASPRAFHDSVAIGDHLYVLGGIGGFGIERASIDDGGLLGQFAPVAESYAYEATGAAHAVVGNHVYAIGGSSGSDTTFQQLATVQRGSIDASGELGTLATVTGPSTPRFGCTVAVIGSSLYLIGGYGAPPLQTATTLTDVERARINADGTLAAFAGVSSPLVVARRFHASAMLGTSLYAIGGQGTSGELATVEHAEVGDTGDLEPFAAVSGVSLIKGRHAHSVLAIGSNLYVLGGFNGTTALRSVEKATITAESFGTFATASGIPLVTARAGHSSIVIGSRAYVIGGTSGTAALDTVEESAITNGALGTFATTNGVTLTTARWGHATAIIGQFVYVFGGFSAQDVVVDTVERAPINADGTLGTFSVIDPLTLSSPAGYLRSVVIDNAVYVLSGSDSAGNPILTIDRATLQ